LLTVDEGEGRFTSVGLENIETGASESERDEPTDAIVVIDDQDPGRQVA
jgi:hypothetical protein